VTREYGWKKKFLDQRHFCPLVGHAERTGNMKRWDAVWIGIVMAVAVSCGVRTAQPGGGEGGLVAIPAGGLEDLTHYRAELVRVIKADTPDGPFERTDHLSTAVWREQKAVFQSIDVINDVGDIAQYSLGMVDQAGYLLPGAADGCRVFWAQDNILVNEYVPMTYLFPLKSGAAAGDETVGGISTRVYNLNSDSLGVKGIEANGKAWIAADGGYLVKYQLELTGGDELYGKGRSGTLTLDYELKEINGNEPVSYPGDCRPVLTDIPVADDAQDVYRMPGWLKYVSPSTPEKMQAFYEEYFSGAGWEKLYESPATEGATDEEKEILFFQESTGRRVTVSLEIEEGKTAVDVDTNDFPPEDTASSADATPAGEPPSSRIMTSLSKLLGSAETPGALPSYAMVLDLELPAASGKIVTHTEAEVEGLNIHYVHTDAGKTTDALLFGGKEYKIVGGKAEAGSIGLRTDWILWQSDLMKVLMAAGLADPKAEPGTTLEGRAVEVFSVDGTDLPDMTGGILPVQITAMRGTIWVDQATGALLKADLTFDADVKKSGQTTPTHDTGTFLLVVSRIGQVKVSMP
jgi:hypothetical protein